MPTNLSIWKFIIRKDDWRRIPGTDNDVSGYLAATVAANAAEAKDYLRRYAAENGMDARWLDVADTIQLPVQAGTFISWAQA